MRASRRVNCKPTISSATKSWVSRVQRNAGAVSTNSVIANSLFDRECFFSGLKGSILYVQTFSVAIGSPGSAIFEPLWQPSILERTEVGISTTQYTFSGGYQFPGSTSHYINLGYNPSLYSSAQTGGHIAFNFTAAPISSSFQAFGITSAPANNRYSFYYSTSASGVEIWDFFDAQNTPTVSVAGFNIGVRQNPSILRWIRNGSFIASRTGTYNTSPPSGNFRLGSRSDGFPMLSTVSFLGLGLGFSSEDESRYYMAFLNLKSRLGR